MYISLTKSETEFLLELLSTVENSDLFGKGIKWQAQNVWEKLYKYKEKMQWKKSPTEIIP